MTAERLYQLDVTLRRTRAEVTGVSPRPNCSGDFQVTFDRTVFFPEEGGQHCDTGRVIHINDPRNRGKNPPESYPVVHVNDVDNELVHIIHVDNPEKMLLTPGDTVEMEIDWDNRFDNMQRHAGEHILSGAVYRLFGGANRGFHMGEDAITIDIDFRCEDSVRNPDGSPRYERLTWEMAMAAEQEANRVIMSDAPIRTDYFSTREEAEKMPLRKKLKIDRDISVVTIGDPDNPADCCACCGTHPSSAGQIGILKIYRIEPNKGMSRIFFECGGRALRHYRDQFNTLYDIGTALSSGIGELPAKFAAYEEKNRETLETLHRLKRRLTEAETEELRRVMKPRLVRHYTDLSVDDLFQIAKRISPDCPDRIALVADPACTVVLVSDGRPGTECGACVKELAARFGARGGGKKESARAIFPDRASLDRFLNAFTSEE